MIDDEFPQLVEKSLGYKPSPEVMRMLLSARNELRTRQNVLENLLSDQKITKELYLDRLISALYKWSRRAQTILGNEQFFKVFGEAGFHPEGLIDRETFLRED